MYRRDWSNDDVTTMTAITENGVRFQLSHVTVLDVGTFGTVYRATLAADDRAHGAPSRTVAVKHIRLSGVSGGHHELDVHKRLRHPNVVPLLFYFYSVGNGIRDVRLNLGMEYAPTNLDHVIRNHATAGRTVSAHRGKLYAYQLFKGLAYMHGTAGLCHRDVKPRNLLVYPMDGLLKLCDFGSTKDLSDGRPNSWYVCSRHYRAPELLFAAVTTSVITPYTTAVDVWSAGCVYAELMRGSVMFPGSNVEHQRALVVRLPILPASAPSDAVRLVIAALRFQPGSRPTALQACHHQCFDELRHPDVRLSDGQRLAPDIFYDDYDGSGSNETLSGDNKTLSDEETPFDEETPLDEETSLDDMFHFQVKSADYGLYDLVSI